MDKTEQILQAAKEGAKKYFDEQVSLLTKFSSIDCGTCDEEGNKKIVAIVENLLNTIQGIQIEKHYSKGFGQHIVAKLKPENPDGKIILSAHMDTVFKKGDTAENPPHIEGDRFYGLGSADCKGGLLVSIYGVKILQENGLLPNKEIVFIFNCDEELLLHIQYLTLKFLVQTWPLYLNRQDWIMELLHPEREPYGYQSKSMA